MARHNRQARRGTMIPLMAICAIGLFAFVALAVDLGMLAVSRTQCQNAADAAALSGCRALNNKPTSANNNLPQAVATAKATATANVHLSANFTDSQVQKVEAGQYLYDPATQRFGVWSWTDVTTAQGTSPAAVHPTGDRKSVGE
jgi:Flp pilus assembly protein TadG